MAERPIDLGWMRMLVEIGRKGSLTAAAEELGLTQPAISYKIRRLEEELGIRLLKRQHRGVELTVEGARLLAVVERNVSEIDQMAREFKAPQRPTIRIHTDYAVSSLWLIPRMQEFRALYPEINIQIAATQNPRQHNADRDDVLIVFGSRVEAGNNATLLLPEKVRPVCAPGFLDCPPKNITPKKLAQSKLIHLDSSWASTWFDWRSYLTDIGIDRSLGQGRGDISFNTYSLVVQSAIEGQGLALGWSGLVDELIRSGALIGVGPVLSAPERGYWLVHPQNRQSAAQKLVDWLLTHAGRDDVDLGGDG